MKTFVDTGAFCAISDSRDDFHAVATRQFSLMLKDKHPLVTTNFVVDETYTWIRYRLGAVQALQFVRKVWESEKGNPALEVVTVTRALEQRAVRLLEKFADQDI
jgi:predicted nucleic acid-binding protein